MPTSIRCRHVALTARVERTEQRTIDMEQSLIVQGVVPSHSTAVLASSKRPGVCDRFSHAVAIDVGESAKMHICV